MSKPPRIALTLPADKRQPASGARGPAADGAVWGETLPETAFAQVSTRRVVAFVIDLCAIAVLWLVFGAMAMVLGVLTLGLLWGPATALLSLVPFLYTMISISSPALQATPGMRLMRLRAASWRRGEPPGLLRGFLMTVIFYATVPATLGLVLFFALFNTRMRLLHDVLSDTVVVNDAD